MYYFHVNSYIKYKKKKGKAETPNRAVQEWLQLADACTAFFGN
jgi:hypothetical protein